MTAVERLRAVKLSEEVRELLHRLARDDERVEVISEMTAGFCRHCGRKLQPGEICHCTNDE